MAEADATSELKIKAHRHGGHAAHAHDSGGHEEHEGGAPEWLISFADNVALLMGFFVVLLALNMMKPTAAGGIGGEKSNPSDEAHSPEMLDAVLAIREAFNNPVSVYSNSPADAALVKRLRDRLLEGDGGQSDSDDGLPGLEREVRSIRYTDRFGAGGRLEFDRGSAELKPATQASAVAVAELFVGMQTVLEVRGHCSAAEAFDQPDRGMRLSYERALAIARVLVDHGVSWDRLRLMACADNERVAHVAYTDTDQQANQRVEVVERADP